MKNHFKSEFVYFLKKKTTPYQMQVAQITQVLVYYKVKNTATFLEDFTLYSM